MVETKIVAEIVLGMIVLGLAIYFFVISSSQIPFPFGIPDDDAVNSMKALSFAISCSASKHDAVKISWSGSFGVQGSMDCPKQACTVGPIQGGCKIQGGDIRRPFGNAQVKCSPDSGGLSCTVTNFLLRQNVAKLDVTNPLSWVSGAGDILDPSKWLAAAGTPRYMAYYESYPAEEYAPFKAKGQNMLMWNMIIGGGTNAVANLIPIFKVSKAGSAVTAAETETAVEASEESFLGGITNRFISILKKPFVTGTTEAAERAVIDGADGYTESVLFKSVSGKISEELGGEVSDKLANEFIEEAAQRTATDQFEKDVPLMAEDVLSKIKTNGYFDDVYSSFTVYRNKLLAQGDTRSEEQMMESLIKGSENELTSGMTDYLHTIPIDEIGTITERYNAEQMMEDSALQTYVIDESTGKGTTGMAGITKDTNGNIIGQAYELDDLPWGKGVAAGTPMQTVMDNLKRNLPQIYKDTGLTDPTLKDTLTSFYRTLDFKKGVTQWLKDQKMAQYLEMQVAAGLLSDTEILGVPASDVPKFMQCRQLGIRWGKLSVAQELTGDALCAILVANDIAVQKAANLNIPTKSVGLNALGLKAAFGGTYTFRLDDDANSFYVPLLKNKAISFSWFSGTEYNGYSPVRFNFASPCRADVTTRKLSEPLTCGMPVSKTTLLSTGNTQYYKWYTAGGTSFLMTQVDNYTYNGGPGQSLGSDVMGVKECITLPTGDLTQFWGTIGMGLKVIYGTVTGNPQVENWPYPVIAVNYTYKSGFCNTEMTGWFAGENALAYLGTTAIDITVTTVATAYTGGLGLTAAKAVSGFATGAALAYLQENVLNLEWPSQRGGPYAELTS